MIEPDGVVVLPACGILVIYLEPAHTDTGSAKRWRARTEHWATLPGRPLATRKEALVRLLDSYQRAAGA